MLTILLTVTLHFSGSATVQMVPPIVTVYEDGSATVQCDSYGELRENDRGAFCYAI